MPLDLAKPPTGRFLRWVLRKTQQVYDYLDAVFQLSRLVVNVTINGVTTKRVIEFTGRNAVLDLNLGTIATSGGTTITHPFQISASASAGKVSVLSGTCNDVVPTNVGSDITLSNGTETLYLDVTIDINGVQTAVTLSHATTGKPADSDYHAYITLGTVVVSGGVVGTISQAATHSLRFAACGRVVSAGPTLDERGTYEFWGF